MLLTWSVECGARMVSNHESSLPWRESRPRRGGWLGLVSCPSSAMQEGAYFGTSLKDIKKASRAGRYDRCEAVSARFEWARFVSLKSTYGACVPGFSWRHVVPLLSVWWCVGRCNLAESIAVMGLSWLESELLRELSNFRQ